jgi:hypothetical protein
MNQAAFKKCAQDLLKEQERLITHRNRKSANGNGIFDRYDFPIVTAAHTPICQGRSKSRPLGRSKSRPVDRCEVVEYAG